MCVLSIVYLLVSVWLYKIVDKKARETASLTRY